MNPNEQQPQPPQKLIDFNNELKALCDKYQYELRPVMQFDPLRGVFMLLQAFDVSPMNQGVPINQAPPAPGGTPESAVATDPSKKNGLGGSSAPVVPSPATPVDPSVDNVPKN